MPNKNKGGFKSGQPKMPDRFKCAKGGEWKTLDAFANSQLKHLHRLQEAGQPINPAHSGMTCREHAAKARDELRCDRCGLIKAVEEFSKNARRSEYPECMRCTAWVETQEPDVTPAPLETGHLSKEEQEMWQGTYIDSADFFDHGTAPEPPVDGMASLNVDAGSRSNVNESFRSVSYADSSVAGSSKAAPSISGASTTSTVVPPPHLAPRIPASDSKNVTFATALKEQTSSPGSVASSSALPPHLRAAAAKAQIKKAAVGSEASDNISQMSGYSRSNSAAESSQAAASRSSQWGQGRSGSSYQSELGSTAGSISTATTVREEKAREAERRKVVYNAWDPKGKQHSNVKQPTVVSSSGVSTSSTYDRPVNNTPMSYSERVKGPVTEPECRGNSKWPKASESRIPQNELKKQPMLPHVSTRHFDPDIDRQRRMAYCDSEDSDY